MPNLLTQEQAKDIIKDFIDNTEQTTNQRKLLFEKYESFVTEGEQWDEDEKPESNIVPLTFNHSEDFVNEYLAKLFPRNTGTGTLEVGVKITEENKKLKEKYEKEILDSYEENEFAKTVLEQGQNFLIGGAGCFYFPKNPITKKANIISIDPTTCYLGWAGTELIQFGFKDQITLGEFEKDKEKQNFFIEKLRNFFLDIDPAVRKYKKIDRFTYWDKNYQIIKIEDEYKITKNEDEFIPATWIPNQPKAHRHEGIPETKKLYTLDKEYNKRATDFGQRVKENTEPTLAISTDMATEDLERDDVKGILPIGKEDKAEFLDLPENREVLEYLALLAKNMDNKMAVNSAVRGEVKSNVSGLSMVYYFSPLMDRLSLKRIYWDQGFKDVNSAILQYKFGKGKYKTKPAYQPMLLSDETTKIENTIKMLDNHLISHGDAIDELRSTENSTEKVKEILEEKPLFEEPKEEFVSL